MCRRNNFIISRWFSERKADEIYTEFLQSSGFSDLSDNANYTEAYEKWIYTEEQSKFIMNAVRDYEEVDCEWITPFFFKQQFNCWAKISNSLRVNNAAFIQCMDHFWDERIRDIEFVGSKVKNKRSIKYRVSMGLYMLFAPTKYHYLFALISRKKYYSYLLRYGRANINHLIVKDYVDWVCNL